MVFNNKMKIVFLILLILACLIVNFTFGRGISYKIEGMGNETMGPVTLTVTTARDNSKSVSFSPVRNEYGSVIYDGYYLEPDTTSNKVDYKKDATDTTQYYTTYIAKKIPYGFEVADKSLKIGILPKSDKRNISGSMSLNLPEYRELSFAEYSQLSSKPIPGVTYTGADDEGLNATIPPRNFRVKKTKTDGSGKIYYEMAAIPINHALLDANNPQQRYLKYTGSYEDIKYYKVDGKTCAERSDKTNQQAYSDNNDYNIYIYSVDYSTNTGEYKIDVTGNNRIDANIQSVLCEYYKIKLVLEYGANDVPAKTKYVMARIPVGFELDTTDKTFTKLKLSNKVDGVSTTYDATVDYNKVDNNSKDQSNQKDAGKGVYYNFDSTGKLVEVNYKESNFAPILYYVPGVYKFGSSNYVPNYEDSVYLSRVTRQSQTMAGNGPNSDNRAQVMNTSSTLGGFCNATKNSKTQMEQKCNALSLDACASTSCCVLLGGQKCVAGNENGAYMTANYSDYSLRNKDFYYYQGKCYGNCNV
jgi:hypothetical protein